MEKQLLEAFLDLFTYENNINSWSFDTFEENTPRYYRLKIIDSLMKALEINCSYIQFSHGSFISNMHSEKWADFKKSIENILPQVMAIKLPSMRIDTFEISILYRTLMRYRLFAQQLLSSNDGIYAFSEEFRAFVELMNIPSRQLIEELKKIDTVLFFCINPNAISYTQEELISQFAFPEINLRDVDIEWM